MKYLAVVSISALVCAAVAGAQTRPAHRDIAAALDLQPLGKACFTRHYSSAHLAQHPHQLVTSMTLLVERQANSPRGAPDGTVFPYHASLVVSVRGKRERYRQGTICSWSDGRDDRNDEAALVCNVECDGGGFALVRSSSPNSIRLRLDYLDGRGIALNGTCDPSENADRMLNLLPGRDDKEFRLTRVRQSDCAELER